MPSPWRPPPEAGAVLCYYIASLSACQLSAPRGMNFGSWANKCEMSLRGVPPGLRGDEAISAIVVRASCKQVASTTILRDCFARNPAPFAGQANAGSQ